MLEQFFDSISWTMTPPPAYGLFHILYTLIGFALCGFVAWKLRHVGERVIGWLLFGCGVFLSATEVCKQFFYYYVINDHAYAWGDFPFQLCSIPMYMCLVAPWLKKGKVQRGMYSFMVLYNLLGGAISFAEPSGLLHGYWFLTVHALMWHMILVFIGLLICFARMGGNEKTDYRYGLFTFLSLCAIAFGLNCFVQFVLGKQMNMFFVGPGNSPLAVFSTFSEILGWYLNTPIYIFAVSLGAYIVFTINYFAQNKELPFGHKKDRQRI